MANKVLAYLQDRPGQDVTVGEMLAAGLAPQKGTLMTYLSRLVNDPSSGVTRGGLDKRTHGVNRPYQYNAPQEVSLLRLRVVGDGQEGNVLAQDDEGMLYEVRSLGKVGVIPPKG